MVQDVSWICLSSMTMHGLVKVLAMAMLAMAMLASLEGSPRQDKVAPLGVWQPTYGVSTYDFASLPSLLLTGGEDDDYCGVHIRILLATLPHLLHPAVFQPWVVPAEVHSAGLPGYHVAGHELHHVQPHHLLLPQWQVGLSDFQQHLSTAGCGEDGNTEESDGGDFEWRDFPGWLCSILC